MQNITLKELLRKYIDQQCTPAELEQIKAFFERPDAEEIFEELLNERRIEETAPADEQQIQSLLQEFHERRVASQPADYPTTGRVRYLIFFKYAAMLTGLLIAAVLGWRLAFYHKPVTQMAWQEVKTPYGHRSVITLPDSSVVTLGAGSKLRFPEQFADGKREVELQGEAFFDVVHHADHPLTVRSGGIQTRDVGTTFKISAFKDQPYRVEVASGEVAVEQLHGAQPKVLARLTPGRAATWNGSGVATTTIIPDDVTAWKSGLLIFNGTPLGRLTQELERCYDVRIRYAAGARPQLHVTTALKISDTPVNQVMKALSASAHFTYTINGKEIWIR